MAAKFVNLRVYIDFSRWYNYCVRTVIIFIHAYKNPRGSGL